MTAEPRTPAAPQTWPGGIQVVGPLLRIPGRLLDIGQLDEAVRHAEAVMDAVAVLRREYPDRPC